VLGVITGVSLSIGLVSLNCLAHAGKMSLFILPSLPDSLAPSPDNEQRCLAAARTTG